MKTVLITGATSGLGLALAQIYQQQGARLVLIGRRPLTNLRESLFSDDCYCQADLARPDAAVIIAKWLEHHDIRQIDVLIHNAAVGYYGSVSSQSAVSIQQLVQINLKAPLALTHTLLPHVTAVRGHIVFVSSVAAVLPTADYVVYTASKAALDGFARSLQVELGSQASVLVLHCGATNTDMHQKLGIPLEKVNWEKFPSAAVVAQKMVNIIRRGRRGQTAVGVGNQILWRAGLSAGYLLERVLRTIARPQRHLPKVKNPHQHVVITGVAEGIGKALALHFGGAGYQVAGIDVNIGGALDTKAEMAQQGVEMKFIAANLAKSADVLQAAEALMRGVKVDVLIHNAGISAVGRFADLELEAQLKVIDVNFTAPLLLTADLLRRDGLGRGCHLVFISSLSHFVGYPGAAVYAATKDGLSSYARGLAVALGREARLLTVYPGPTRTAHARRYSPDNSHEASRISPEQTAELIGRAVERHRRFLLPGTNTKLFALLGYFAPRLMERAVKRLIFDKL